MQSSRKIDKERKVRVLNFVALGIFSATTFFGIIRVFSEATRASGVLIVLVGIIGVLLSFSSRIAKRFWQVDIPFSALLIINLFVFLAVIPGEVFGFYYRVWWWDVFLHVFSGFGIAFISNKIFSAVLTKTKMKYKSIFIVIITVFASLGGAAAWEVAEFTVDSCFKTNMQKFIPPEFLPQNVGSVEALEATDARLSKYYRQPNGYRYALMDTMGDHVAYLAGVMLWLVSYRLRKT